MKEVTVAALEKAIENALMPGRYIDWRSRCMFINRLHEERARQKYGPGAG